MVNWFLLAKNNDCLSIKKEIDRRKNYCLDDHYEDLINFNDTRKMKGIVHGAFRSLNASTLRFVLNLSHSEYRTVFETYPSPIYMSMPKKERMYEQCNVHQINTPLIYFAKNVDKWISKIECEREKERARNQIFAMMNYLYFHRSNTIDSTTVKKIILSSREIRTSIELSAWFEDMKYRESVLAVDKYDDHRNRIYSLSECLDRTLPNDIRNRVTMVNWNLFLAYHALHRASFE